MAVHENSVRRWLIGLAAVLAGVALLTGTSLTFAGERVRFKNGYVLDVKSSRVDGETVYLRLYNDSEIGVPRALLDEIEQGRERPPTSVAGSYTNFAGRGRPFEELHGFKRLLAQSSANGRVLGAGAGVNPKKDPNAVATFGFSWYGSGDIADAVSKNAPQVRATTMGGSIVQPRRDNEPMAVSSSYGETGPRRGAPRTTGGSSPNEPLR